MLCLMKIKTIKSKLFYCLILVLLLNIVCLQNSKANSNMELSDYKQYQNLAKLNIDIESVMSINEPFFNGKGRNIRMYRYKYGDGAFKDTYLGLGFINDKSINNFEYRYKTNWVYFPLIDKYLRLTAIGVNDKTKCKEIINGICYVNKDGNDKISYKLNLFYEEQNQNNKNEKNLKLDTKNLVGQNFDILIWHSLFGINCFQDQDSGKLTCYNELDTNDYDRFYFTGNEMTKFDMHLYFKTDKTKNVKLTYKKHRCIKNNQKNNSFSCESVKNLFNEKYYDVDWNKYNNLKYGEWFEYNIISKTIETYQDEIYGQIFNANTIWKGELNKNETLVDLLKNTINNSKNNKILIIVPKSQLKLFIKIIKQIPDGYFKDKVGYVWFFSKQPKQAWYMGLEDIPVGKYNPKNTMFSLMMNMMQNYQEYQMVI